MINIINRTYRAAQNKRYNTWIGGVGATFPTVSDWVAFLKRNVGDNNQIKNSDFRNYEVVGLDIRFKANAQYTFNLNNEFDPFKFIIDYGKKITNIFIASPKSGGFSFIYAPVAKIERVNVNINLAPLHQLEYLINDSATDIGASPGEGNLFSSNAANAKFYVNNYLATNNAGSPDAALQSAISQGATVVYRTNDTAPLINDISVTDIGGTYCTLNIDRPSHTNTLKYILVFLNGIFTSLLDYSQSFFVPLIPTEELNSLEVILADEFFNISPLSRKRNFTTTAIDVPALQTNIVANYPFDETTGDAIDTINGEDGTLIGSISRDGEYYTYGGANAVVEVPNNANLNFIDGNGANVDFTIKTEFIATALNSSNRFWLVTKRASDSLATNGWRLLYINGNFEFIIWSNQNTILRVTVASGIDFNAEYMFGVSKIGSNLFLNLNGVQVATATIPNGFVFNNSTSIMQMGNSSAFGGSNRNLIGKQKRTVILKGRGWTQGDWSDAYNGGNGIDI
jgi:hypothetical protein